MRNGNVFRNIHQNRTGTTGTRNVKRTAHGLGQIFDIAHKEIVFDAWPGNTDGIALLECVFTDGVRRHLTTDDHHRNRVHVGCGNASHGIGHARATGHQANAYFIGRTRISVGSVNGSLLVSDQNMFEFVLLVNRVVNVEHSPTGIAKDVFYAFVSQTTRDDISAIEFHDVIPFITGIAHQTVLLVCFKHIHFEGH